MLLYGLALFNGDGVRRDPVLGYAYASRAAALGFAPAKEALAQFDQVLPPGARKKALAIASAKTAPPPSPKPTKAAQTAATQTKPTPSAPAPSVGATGAWRIQLGAFSQRASAEALYHKLSGSFGGRQAFYIPVGAITRLQVGPYPGRAAAQAACGALKGQACFPVPAK